MLQVALGYRQRNVSFAHGAAENLPFSSRRFDTVTAFSAFHWFCNEAAYEEIRRVTKEGGSLTIVNKEERDDTGEYFRTIVQRFSGSELPNIKMTYDPSSFLVGQGAMLTVDRQLPCVEEYSSTEALHALRSRSLWNLVPMESRGEATAALEEWISRRVDCDGHFKRSITVRVISVLLKP